MSTIKSLIEGGSRESVALSAAGLADATFAELATQIERTVAALNAVGIGRSDRVAIVLPNGPLMASAFVCAACGTATAPLNQAYRADEFDFYLDDLDAKALIVERGSDSPARQVAEKKGIRILEIEQGENAAEFSFVGVDAIGDATADADFSGPADTALLLHTSGTTSRPKLVPLTHENLVTSAHSIRRSLALTANDRCMNVMPLFHIHGLVAAILASLGAGGSTYCTAGFNALRFFAAFEEAKPSWFTAVPTMHQAIVGRAARNQNLISAQPLRFIRSCSAALPPQVMEEVEATFDCPVIEAYAMTEAAHQMTSNPLPPAARKPGSVGIAAGPEVAIMDEAGELQAAGTIGEVVIQGANVTPGYVNNPTANAENFENGWFRTGDQGVFDDQGYLTITGRLKEIINRGGEKISPREVDEVLLDHPAVAQVVTFAMPHAKLGEDVAAAVVLAEGEQADDSAIRAFAATRLADFKVPRRVIFLDEIPKGPTGKLQRIGLAEKLGLE